jgi:hypothetical protein
LIPAGDWQSTQVAAVDFFSFPQSGFEQVCLSQVVDPAFGVLLHFPCAEEYEHNGAPLSLASVGFRLNDFLALFGTIGSTSPPADASAKPP